MNKKILYGVAVFVVAIIAAGNVNYSSKTKGMSDVMFANIEVLANSEGGSDSWYCWSALEKGTGCWRCGSPCEWEAKKSPGGGRSECHN